MANTNSNKSGIALILVAGVLAVLVMVAICFALNARFEQISAANYTKSIKAKYLAEAGINRAIAELKQDAKDNFVYGDDSNELTGTGLYSAATLYNNCGSYSVDVYDEQRKININDTNSALALTLAGLPTIDNATEAQAIIVYRNGLPGGKFETTEQISQTNEDAGVDIDYSQLKDYITSYSYQDQNTIDDTGASEARCPINVNTADKEVIKAILTGISDGGPNTISDTEADAVADDIIANRPSFTNLCWNELDDVIDNCVPDDITQDEADLIKDAYNPNRTKPSTYTTDFCFNSGGKYTLVSTGTIQDADGDVIAEKKVKAVVDIYDVFASQTDKSDFQGGPDEATPVAHQVTTLDSCPVEPIDDAKVWSTADYRKVHDSIKNGFWDNFDDNNSTAGDEDLFYVDGTWKQASRGNRMGCLWDCREGEGDVEIYSQSPDAKDTDSDNELIFYYDDTPIDYEPDDTTWRRPIVILGDSDTPANSPAELMWKDYAFRAISSPGKSPFEKLDRYAQGDEGEIDLKLLTDTSGEKATFGELSWKRSEDELGEYPTVPPGDPDYLDQKCPNDGVDNDVIENPKGSGEDDPDNDSFFDGCYIEGEEYEAYYEEHIEPTEEEPTPLVLEDRVRAVEMDRYEYYFLPAMTVWHCGRYYEFWSDCTRAVAKQEFMGDSWHDDATKVSGFDTPHGSNNNRLQLESQVKGGGVWPPQVPNAWYDANAIIIVQDGFGTNQTNWFYGYKADNRPNFYRYWPDPNDIGNPPAANDTRDDAHHIGPVAFTAWGACKLDGERSWVDDVRIIPEGDPTLETYDGPYFESEPITNAGITEDFTWGVIAGTTTLSDGGNPLSERIYFQTSTNGGTSWEPADPGVLSGGSITSSDEDTSIQYKANFTTLDNPNNTTYGIEPYFSETIALEDVTITYIPKTKILYYTEVPAG